MRVLAIARRATACLFGFSLIVLAIARRATAHLFLAEPYPFAKKAFSLNQTRQKKTHRPPPYLGITKLCLETCCRLITIASEPRRTRGDNKRRKTCLKSAHRHRGFHAPTKTARQYRWRDCVAVGSSSGGIRRLQPLVERLKVKGSVIEPKKSQTQTPSS